MTTIEIVKLQFVSKSLIYLLSLGYRETKIWFIKMIPAQIIQGDDARTEDVPGIWHLKMVQKGKRIKGKGGK